MKDLWRIEEGFAARALAIFREQAAHNPIYASYLDLLQRPAREVRRVTDIPFLPIALFKTHELRTGQWLPARTFTSSGTTGSATSRHDLRDEAHYRANARQAFERWYGPLRGRPVLALLPSYLERSGSSLVFMVEDFIARSGHPNSDFYLADLESLARQLALLRNTDGPRPLLIGVSFALLDLAERFPAPLGHTIVMETGGMKGRRREMTRAELHRTLKSAFSVEHIHSEYGMTELLSQAYAPTQGRFYPAPTLAALTRQITDPLALTRPGQTGVLNLIDLANRDTISFVATDDLGRVDSDGTFEVLGRLDAADVRGCNLLVSAVNGQTRRE